jgi:hypothetical protein
VQRRLGFVHEATPGIAKTLPEFSVAQIQVEADAAFSAQ